MQLLAVLLPLVLVDISEGLVTQCYTGSVVYQNGVQMAGQSFYTVNVFLLFVVVVCLQRNLCIS